MEMNITFMLHFQQNSLETFHKFIIQSNIINEAQIPKKKPNLRARAAASASKNRTEQSGSIKICKMQIVQSIQIDHNWHYLFCVCLVFFPSWMRVCVQCFGGTFNILTALHLTFLPHTIRSRFDPKIILQFIE